MHVYLQIFAMALLTLVLTSTVGVVGAETSSSSGCTSKKAPGQRSIGLKSASDLRGDYYSSEEEGSGAPVGRLSILLLSEEEGSRQVSLHHRFHTGDGFKFVVSSNREGWLYILHRSPGGEPQLLWPLQEEERYLNLNQVRTGRKLTVPPSPGKFIFDDEVGNEYFYVVIRPERLPPMLSAMDALPDSDVEPFAEKPLGSDSEEGTFIDPKKIQATLSPEPKQRIVQFSIRGSNRPIRGVIFDPGPQDTDPHTYFSTPPEDDFLSNVFEFQLHHEK
jgi:Domain of unknown function (DUF4384)